MNFATERAILREGWEAVPRPTAGGAVVSKPVAGTTFQCFELRDELFGFEFSGIGDNCANPLGCPEIRTFSDSARECGLMPRVYAASARLFFRRAVYHDILEFSARVLDAG